MGRWVDAVSSNIDCYKFDLTGDKIGTLTIQYRGGSVYDYHNVPEELVDQMESHLSLGSFVHRNLVGKYEYIRSR